MTEGGATASTGAPIDAGTSGEAEVLPLASPDACMCADDEEDISTAPTPSGWLSEAAPYWTTSERFLSCAPSHTSQMGMSSR